jgi:hypothetical protein
MVEVVEVETWSRGGWRRRRRWRWRLEVRAGAVLQSQLSPASTSC